MTRAALLLAALLPLACGPGTGTSDPGSTDDPGTGADATTAPTTDTPTTSTSETTTTDDLTAASASTTAPTGDDTGPVAPCTVTAVSDLPGVSILFPEQDCVFTLAEAAAGLDFKFEVEILEPLADVTPAHNDAGGCDQPGPSGLITFPTVSGGDEHHCICDQGICPGFDVTVDLAAGTFADNFPWDGVNWSGPSDTNNPKGDPFPPGAYDVTVRARGFHGIGERMQPFTVTSTLEITLVP